jgi:hypothetical protein
LDKRNPLGGRGYDINERLVNKAEISPRSLRYLGVQFLKVEGGAAE